MIPVLSDVVFAIVEAGMEIGCSVAGVSKEQKAALDAAMAATAACCGAAAVATANAVQVAVVAANEIMDEAGVAADSPLRQAVSTSLQAAGTVMGGGASAASIAGAAVQVAADGTAMGMQEAGVEGAGALRVASSVVASSSGGDINLSETGVRAGTALVGGGIAAASAGGGDDEEMFAAMASGVQIGASVGGVGSNLATGLSTPASSATQPAATPQSSTDGPVEAAPTTTEQKMPAGESTKGDKKPPTPEEVRAEALEQAQVQAVDLAVGGVVTAIAHQRAEENGKADVHQSIKAGFGVKIGQMTTGKAWTEDELYKTAAVAFRAATSIHEVHNYTEYQSRVNKYAADHPELAALYDKRAKTGTQAVKGSLTPAADVAEGKYDDWKPVWEPDDDKKDAS